MIEPARENDPMTFVERGLAGQRLFVELPAGVADWVPAFEVAIQEGVRGLAFWVEEVHLVPEALALFGRRARLGVFGALTPEDVRRAREAGAHFVTSPLGDAALVAAAGDLPFLPGGLTPTELRAAAGGLVQVVPADVMPMSYARSLASLLGGRPFAASGRLERFQCEMWFEAGAQVVGIAGETLVGPAGLELGELRARCQSYASVVPTA